MFVGGYGVFQMAQAVEKAERDAQRAEYQAELWEFVNRRCGPFKGFGDEDNRKWCQYEAKKAFEESGSK